MMLNCVAKLNYLKIFLVFFLLQNVTCDCPFPKKNHLPNGRFVFLDRKRDAKATMATELYMLRFKCFTGYERIGPRYIQCINEQWTDAVPICAKMQCTDPPVIEDARFKLHAGVDSFPTLGSSVVYSCNVGYELNDTAVSTLHCVLDPGANDARWDGEMPFCKAKESCPDPGVSKHGTRTGSCCFSGDSLQYSCNEGYELIGSKEIECHVTGRWSTARPLCKPLGDFCESPPNVPHGVVVGKKDGDYFRPDDEAEVLCRPGYKYKGSSRFILCKEGGEWEEQFGECVEISCDRPPLLANGSIPELLSTNWTNFPHLFEVSYVCEEGHRLIGGDSWRTCEKDGWSGKTPYCEEIQCPDPGDPESGNRIGSNFGVGAKVRFRCFAGYNLIGSIERYCKPNGLWTGELSRCDSSNNYCPNPGVPIKGSKTGTSYDMGDKVSFRCEPGYIHLGSEVRECLPNRTWSGTEASCLGPYDFDNSAQVRDSLKSRLAEKAEEQKIETERYMKALHASWRNGRAFGRMLDINYPGRLIMYFTFDVSGSVGRHNFNKSIEFAKAIVKRITLGRRGKLGYGGLLDVPFLMKVGISENGARAGAITFSSKAENMFLPLSYKTTEDVVDALEKIEYTGGGTSASSALNLIREENIPLVAEVLGRRNIKFVVFIITDGKANMGGNPEIEAEILKASGVEIFCIGITGSVKKESLYKIASTSKDGNNGEQPNVYILQNYATLSWLVQEITNGTVDYSQCGLGMENVEIEGYGGRVIGGKKTTDPWPWMAALYMRSKSFGRVNLYLQCGGSIVNRNFILTAAHCMLSSSQVGERNGKEIIVKLGLTDVKNETYVQEAEVHNIFIHPRYRPGSYDYDIALLELDRPIEYNSFVRPICLPPSELPPDSPLYRSNEFGWATGWGHEGPVSRDNQNQNLKSSQFLKELRLPIQPRERCIQSLVDNRIKTTNFTDRMFCAGDAISGNDTCLGDSGGPLMQSQLNADGYLYWTQVGIVSWGIGCGQRNTYGYYTHVQRLSSWILEHY